MIEVHFDLSLAKNQYCNNSTLWNINNRLYRKHTIRTSFSPKFAMETNATTPIIVRKLVQKFIVTAVPAISPSLSGELTNSLTSVAFNPNCIKGVANATIDAA